MKDRLHRVLTEAAGHPAAPYIALALLSLLLFGRAARFELLPTWDDADYILHNPLVTAPLDLAALRGIFTTPVLGNFAPLHILVNSLQYHIWGTAPSGYHLVSVAVHGANACLLYALLRRMTGSGAISFWAALLFTVHPANVENIAWVSEQKTLFATAFALLAMLSYLRYRDDGRPRFLTIASVLFCLSLLFKVSMLPLPLVLLAWELMRGRLREGWTATIPFFLLAVLAAGLAVWAQMEGGAVEQGTLDPGFLFGTVYPTMAPVLWNYPRLVLFPFGLSAYYDAALHGSFLDLPVLASLVALALLLILVAWKGSGRVRFWAFWFCVLLLPVSNIIPLPVYYADRYLYLPAVGMFVLIGIAVEELVRRAPALRRAVRIAAPAAVVVMAVLAGARFDVWRNDRVLWEDTVRTSPGLYKPHLNLGIAYADEGRYDDAERELLASLAIRPTEKARYHLAVVRAKREYYERNDRNGT